jgi:hypothetical protein
VVCTHATGSAVKNVTKPMSAAASGRIHIVVAGTPEHAGDDGGLGGTRRTTQGDHEDDGHRQPHER